MHKCLVGFISDHLSSYVQQKYVVASIGQTVRFHCIITGFPLISVVWLKDSKILNQRRGISIEKDVLQISSVRKEDRGMYQCLVTNDDESVQAAAELQLGGIDKMYLLRDCTMILKKCYS